MEHAIPPPGAGVDSDVKSPAGEEQTLTIELPVGVPRDPRVGRVASQRFSRKVVNGMGRLNVLRDVWAASVSATTGSTISLVRRENADLNQKWFEDGWDWIRRFSVGSGVFACARELKKFSSACRTKFLLEGSDVQHRLLRKCPPLLLKDLATYGQLSMLGRALPYGAELETASALKAHKHNLLDEFKCHDDDLESVRRYSREWAEKFLPKVPKWEDVAGLVTSTSASFSSYRSSGGLNAELTDLMARSDVEVPEPPAHIPWNVWMTVCAELIQMSSAEGVDPLSLQRGRVTVIPERGLKTRIVAAMQPSPLILGQLARRRLAVGLKRWGLTRDTIAGKSHDAVNRLIGATGKVLSSDLTTASDLIPLGVASAIVDGLIESGRFLQAEVYGLKHGVASQRLTWPDGETADTCRGILMGLPCTWSLLCIYHGWCWEGALEKQKLFKLPSGESIRAQAVICGDDLLGVAVEPAIKEYESRLNRTGAILSKGKHCISPNRGVFLEELWTFFGSRQVVAQKGLPIYRVRRGKAARRMVRIDTRTYLKMERKHRSSAMPLRGLVEGLGPDERSRDLPLWMGAGLANAAYAAAGFSLKTIHAVSSTLWNDLAGRFQKVGIPPYLPRKLGGAGLVHPKVGPKTRVTKLASKAHRRSMASLLWGQAADPKISYERLWTPILYDELAQMAEDDVNHCIADYTLQAYGLPPPKGLVNLGNLDDVRLRGMTWARESLAIQLGAAGLGTAKPSFQRLVAAHSKLGKDLRKVWHPEATRKSIEECESKWDDLHRLEVQAPLGAFTGSGNPPSETVLNEHAFLAFPLLLANARRLATAELATHWEISFLLSGHQP